MGEPKQQQQQQQAIQMKQNALELKQQAIRLKQMAEDYKQKRMQKTQQVAQLQQKCRQLQKEAEDARPGLKMLAQRKVRDCMALVGRAKTAAETVGTSVAFLEKQYRHVAREAILLMKRAEEAAAPAQAEKKNA